MKTLTVGLSLALSLSVYVPVAVAAEPEAAKAKDIQTLLVLTKAGDLGKQVFTQVVASFQNAVPGVPAEFWNGLVAEVKTDEVVRLIVPIYDRHFSHQDIKDLIQFYQSPIGKKLVEKQSLLVQESMQVGEAWGKSLADKTVSRLKEEGYLKDGPQGLEPAAGKAAPAQGSPAAAPAGGAQKGGAKPKGATKP